MATMATLSHWRTVYNGSRAGLVASGLVLLLATSAAALNSTCYCNPLDPYGTNPCRTDWIVKENATGFHNVVCNGTPPGTGGTVFAAPHPCPELAYAIAGWTGSYFPSGITQNPNGYLRIGVPIASTFTLTSTGNSLACPGLPDSDLGIHFINLWPGSFPGHEKSALARILRSNIGFLRDQHKKLEGFPPFSPAWRGIKMTIASIINVTASLVMAMKDPINHDYAHVIVAPTLPAFVPVVAGGDLTPAQATAINAWALAMRTVSGHTQHMNKTVDAIAGALEAAPVSATGRQWAVTHAQQIDALGDRIAAAGVAELALRPALVAAFPPLAVPASYCLTSLLLGGDSVQAVEAGVDLYELGQLHQYAKDKLCSPASTWPASLLAGLADWQTAYAVFAALQYADAVCAQAGYCGTPSVQASPSPARLPAGPVGVASVALVTIANAGTAPLVLAPLAFVGGAPARFSLPPAKDHCSRATLAPGTSCTVRVRVIPTVPGPVTTKLLITSNDPAHPTLKLPLKGMGQ